MAIIRKTLKSTDTGYNYTFVDHNIAARVYISIFQEMAYLFLYALSGVLFTFYCKFNTFEFIRFYLISSSFRHTFSFVTQKLDFNS